MTSLPRLIHLFIALLTARVLGKKVGGTGKRKEGTEERGKNEDQNGWPNPNKYGGGGGEGGGAAPRRDIVFYRKSISRRRRHSSGTEKETFRT